MDAYEEYKRDLEEFMNLSVEGSEYFPVNYSVLSGGKFYLSPAVITKEISNNSIGKLAGDFAPCSGAMECPACELFGHVSKESSYSRGSKVRFSDLYVTEERDNKDYFYNVCTLPVLSSPKLGNVEFYLKKPEDATFWTYDYYVENGQVKMEQEQLQLRGRKYYWHHPGKNVLSKMPSDIKPDRLNKTVRPLKENIKFSGQLYFEGISDRQLKQLVWLCNSGSEQLGYKLGAAKPFGFGSIICEVTAVEVRDIDIQDGRVVYSKSPDQKDKYNKCSYEEAGFSMHCKEQFYRIAGLASVEERMKITYPKTQKQFDNNMENEGFRWYVQNRKTMTGDGMPRSRTDIRICTTLPTLEETDVCLPCSISEESVGDGTKDGKKSVPEEAEVVDIISNGMKLRVKKIKDGETVDIHIKNLGIDKKKMPVEYPKNTKVLVEYTGKDNKGYPTYHVEK